MNVKTLYDELKEYFENTDPKILKRNKKEIDKVIHDYINNNEMPLYM